MKAVLCVVLLALALVAAVDVNVEADASQQLQEGVEGLTLYVDFQIPTNAQKHHTHMFREGGAPQQSNLIIRLWQPFVVKAVKGTKFPPGATFWLQDDISGSKEVIQLTAQVTDGTTATLSPNFNAVGRYYLHMRVGSSTKAAWISKTKIYALFNPWEEKCDTYALGPDAKSTSWPVDINEHVLSESGAVWRGSSTSNSPMPWAYNQFDMMVLNVIMDGLAPLSLKQRDVVRVTRWLTVFTQNVLIGRWDGEYSDGKPPGHWQSTTMIMTVYTETKESVKYGQCWVFSSLYTSLGRSLGVPTLSITNFDSAHEEKPFRQMCEMKYTISAGKWQPAPSLSTCSIWNFHVWNQGWFKRRDLPAAAGAGGWQALDATPQEESTEGPNEAPFNEANYFTGPASLNVMLKEDYKGKYDNGFVGGEVNAKVYYFHCTDEKGRNCTKTSPIARTDAVGELMIAKKPGDGVYPWYFSRAYSKVGSFLELEAFHQSAKPKEPIPDFIATPPSKLELGKQFYVSLKRRSGAFIHGDHGYSITIRPISYMTGLAKGEDLWHETRVVKGTGEGMALRFRPDFWTKNTTLAALTKTNMFQFIFSAVPKNGGQPFFTTVGVNVLRPELTVICGLKPNPKRHRKDFKQGDTIHCAVKLMNPLTIPLTKAKVALTITAQSSKEEASQLSAQAKTVTQQVGQGTAEDLDSNGESMQGRQVHYFNGFQFKLVGRAGTQQVQASLIAKELRDLYGHAAISIRPDSSVVAAESSSEKSQMDKKGLNPAADEGQVTTSQEINQSSSQQKAEAIQIVKKLKTKERPSAGKGGVKQGLASAK